MTDAAKKAEPKTLSMQIDEAKQRSAKPAPVRLIVDADLFLRAYTCVSTEETRYYLNGVCIEDEPSGGAFIVSTDGHRLVCLRDKKGYAESEKPAIVRADANFLRLIRNAPSKWRWPDKPRRLVVVDGSRMALVELNATTAFDDPESRDLLFKLTIEPNDLVVGVQTSEVLIDGTYPAWRKVCPVLDPTAPIGAFNVHLLSSFASALGSKEHKGVRLVCGASTDTIRHGETSDPIFIRSNNPDIDGFGIIMPMRVGDLVQYPDWMKIKTLEERDARILAKKEKVAGEREQALKANIIEAEEKIAQMKAARAAAQPVVMETTETPDKPSASPAPKRSSVKKTKKAVKKTARRTTLRRPAKKTVKKAIKKAVKKAAKKPARRRAA